MGTVDHDPWDQKLHHDRYLIRVFIDDTMTVKVSNKQYIDKFKYYGVLIIE
jgi:hypothetical protein